MSGVAPPPAGALLARHLSVGVLTSLALAIADVSVGGARPAGGAMSSMSWADRLLAFFNTAGMLAPIGLVVGVALAGALFVFQRTPWFDALRESHQSVSVLFRRAPEAFSSALAWSVAAWFAARANVWRSPAFSWSAPRPRRRRISEAYSASSVTKSSSRRM